MDCSICCVTTNLKNPVVGCGFCDIQACRQCCERYLLSTFDDPHCMGCKHEWDKDKITKDFSKNFVTKKLKEHRENVLFEREKSLLPHSQDYVDAYLALKNTLKIKNKLLLRNKQIDIDMCRMKLEELKNDAEVLKGTVTTKEATSVKKHNKTIADELNREKRANERKIRNVANDETKECPKPKLKTSHGKCPMDGCLGYISANWCCGVCEKKICSRCMEEETDGHECDPDTVETVKAIKKDSKPCPGCGTCVVKASGCDQMWCVQCHTAFSWRTGQRVHGFIHNPHYFQWMNRNGRADRNARDIPCGGLVDYMTLLDTVVIRHKLPNAGNARDNFGMVYRCISHITHVELPRYATVNAEADNGVLRARYLLKEISESEFKAVIQRNEKKREKRRAFGAVMTMYAHTAADIFRNITATDDIKSQFNDLIELTNYTCEQLIRITKMYDCAMIKYNGSVNDMHTYVQKTVSDSLRALL